MATLASVVTGITEIHVEIQELSAGLMHIERELAECVRKLEKTLASLSPLFMPWEPKISLEHSAKDRSSTRNEGPFSGGSTAEAPHARWVAPVSGEV